MADNEVTVIGPPGTGKTTSLARSLARAVDEYGANQVLLTSLTRASAQEIARKVSADGTEIPETAIGTLHSHCFRALNVKRDEMTVSSAAVAEWNEAYPQWRQTDSRGGVDEPPEWSGRDDRSAGLERDYHRLRGMMIPRDEWRHMSDYFAELARYAAARDDWKKQTERYDFTDLIERCLTDVFYAPGGPSVIYVDEAQDHNRMQMELLRKWSGAGRTVQRLYMTGDVQQCLYEWAGSDAEAFLSENRHVLQKSWRVPRAVHAAAMKFWRRSRRPFIGEYQPRDADGRVIDDSYFSFKRPGYLVDQIKDAVKREKTVMALTACSYQLSPLLRELRDRGVPFWNPNRFSRGDWNPLQGKATTGRLLAYLAVEERNWTWGDVKAWSQLCSNTFRRGAAKEIEEREASDEAGPEALTALIACTRHEDCDPQTVFNGAEWLRAHAKAQHLDRLKYLLAVGVDRIQEAPQVKVGTIHSVKGDEADVVFVSPDLPSHVDAESLPVYRQWYVAMTRAREELVLCGQGERNGVQW